MKRLLLAAFCAILMVSQANGQSTLALQEKCANAANEKFDKEYGGTLTKSKTLGSCINNYENHYNKKLDKCFILMRASCVEKDKRSDDIVFGDLFENKPYAIYTCQYSKEGVLQVRFCTLGDTQFNVLNGLEFNKETKKWDIISEAYNHSLKNPFSDPIKEKFDKWIKPYMEE